MAVPFPFLSFARVGIKINCRLRERREERKKGLRKGGGGGVILHRLFALERTFISKLTYLPFYQTPSSRRTHLNFEFLFFLSWPKLGKSGDVGRKKKSLDCEKERHFEGRISLTRAPYYYVHRSGFSSFFIIMGRQSRGDPGVAEKFSLFLLPHFQVWSESTLKGGGTLPSNGMRRNCEIPVVVSGYEPGATYARVPHNTFFVNSKKDIPLLVKAAATEGGENLFVFVAFLVWPQWRG